MHGHQRFGERYGGADAVDDRHAALLLDALVESGHAAAAEDDHLGLVVVDGGLGLGHDCGDGGFGILFEGQHRQIAGAYRGAAGVQSGQHQPVFDHRHGAVQGGDHRVGAADQHRDDRGGFGDVEDGHVYQLLQPFAAVLAEAGLDDRVERFGIGAYGIHHRDRGEVAFEVTFHGFGAESSV